MVLFWLSIGLTILSNVLYHLSQKLTPANISPMVALGATYGTALIICILLLPFFPPKDGLLATIRQLNWASFGLAFAIIGLEVGFLLAYRAGWNIGLAAIVSNASVTLILIPLAVLLFKEKVTPLNLVGVAACILGLILINQK